MIRRIFRSRPHNRSGSRPQGRPRLSVPLSVPLSLPLSLSLLAIVAGCASSPPTCTSEDNRIWAAANANAIRSVDYPEQARAQEREGTVRLSVSIDDADSVRQVLVESSSGHADLDEAALAAGRAGAFRSPVCGGRKLARTFVVPVDFRLEK